MLNQENILLQNMINVDCFGFVLKDLEDGAGCLSFDKTTFTLCNKINQYGNNYFAITTSSVLLVEVAMFSSETNGTGNITG